MNFSFNCSHMGDIEYVCPESRIIVQHICGDNQTKGSVSDKSTKISRELAEMILFKISYGPKLKKIQDGRHFQDGGQIKNKSFNFIVIIKQ